MIRKNRMNMPIPPPPPYPPPYPPKSPIQKIPLPPPPPLPLLPPIPPMPPLPPLPTIPTTFSLNETQLKEFNQWSTQFYDKVNGSVFTFSFTPTNCGTIVVIQHTSGQQLILHEE